MWKWEVENIQNPSSPPLHTHAAQTQTTVNIE